MKKFKIFITSLFKSSWNVLEASLTDFHPIISQIGYMIQNLSTSKKDSPLQETTRLPSKEIDKFCTKYLWIKRMKRNKKQKNCFYLNQIVSWFSSHFWKKREQICWQKYFWKNPQKKLFWKVMRWLRFHQRFEKSLNRPLEISFVKKSASCDLCIHSDFILSPNLFHYKNFLT